MLKNLIIKFKGGPVRDSALYALIIVINRLIPFILLPILTYSLSQEEYGSYSLFKTIATFLTPIASFSVGSVALKRYYDYSKQDFEKFLFNILLLAVFIFISLLLLVLIFNKHLINLLEVHSLGLVLFSLLFAFSLGLTNIYASIFRAQRKILNFALLQIISPLLFFGVFLILNSIKDINVIEVIMLQVFMHICTVFVFMLKMKIRFSFELKFIIDAIKYCFPVTVYMLVAGISSNIDRFYINKVLSKEELAIYSAMFQISSIMIMFGKAIQLSWTPYVFERLKKGISVAKILRENIYLSILLILLGAGVGLIAPYLIKILLPEEYSSGINFIYFFITATILNSLYWLYNPIVLFYEKNYYFVVLSSIAGLSSILLNSFFAKEGLLVVSAIFLLSWLIHYVGIIIIVYHGRFYKKIKKTVYQS